MFSPDIFWSGLTVNLCGCEVQACSELIGGEASEDLEPSGEVIGVNEVAQMSPQLIVGFVRSSV